MWSDRQKVVTRAVSVLEILRSPLRSMMTNPEPRMMDGPCAHTASHRKRGAGLMVEHTVWRNVTTIATIDKQQRNGNEIFSVSISTSSTSSSLCDASRKSQPHPSLRRLGGIIIKLQKVSIMPISNSISDTHIQKSRPPNNNHEPI